MGKTEYHHSGGVRTDFWPDDTETEMYIASDVASSKSLRDLMAIAVIKWGDAATFDNIYISVENIHTHAIYYDRHDPSDWTCFIKLEKRGYHNG